MRQPSDASITLEADEAAKLTLEADEEASHTMFKIEGKVMPDPSSH